MGVEFGLRRSFFDWEKSLVEQLFQSLQEVKLVFGGGGQLGLEDWGRGQLGLEDWGESNFLSQLCLCSGKAG